MAYSVMLWLVNPNCQSHESEALEMLKKRSRYPGARGGINEPPVVTRLVYGVFDEHREAKRVLEKIAHQLEKEEPLMVEMPSGDTFVVPPGRIHYVVMSEAVQPKEEDEERKLQSFINR